MRAFMDIEMLDAENHDEKPDETSDPKPRPISINL
jgi:hypothetical protein